uniref:APC membrane recruitment protein 2 n=1 Tax=Mola mola TaxID=94237 RepID=A0A3Q3X8D8_MOLML
MDVQTENTDPPPCESQSSGKIRKGFKLFGKRKPGNIFSIRNKGDGNNKSPVNKSKTLDGLSETGAPHSESEPDKNRGQEVSQGEIEQAEEEALGEDAVQAFTHGRNSISSVCSARSLSFLSLLRGGRRGTGGRQVHTVSQPAGRQRRGLKGLFGNVKLRSNEKDEKEGAPPSPLLMSSRANSVEIIKEDLTLTPKSQPRSLDSPEMKNCDTHSDSPPVSESSTSIIKSTITLTTGTPLSAPATITTISSTTTSSPLMTIKSTPNSTSAATAPPITSATIFTAPSVSPSINSSVSILASETVAPPKMVPSVIKPSPVDTPTSPAPSKTPPVTHSPPVSVALTQPLPAKTDLVSNVNLQTPTSYKPTLSSAAEESKAPVTVSPACTVSLKSSSPATVITQPKVFTSLPRDSKIPVKHGAQSPTTSQIPQAKELPRTKIPVSKVPVRRVGNKPAAGSVKEHQCYCAAKKCNRC